MATKIPSKTIQALVGSLLGDGTLQIQKKSKNALFRETHSIKQKEYAKWKMQFFTPLDPKYKEVKIFDSRTEKYYYHALFWTKVHPVITKFHSLVYKNNKKNFKEVVEYISPLSLAIWYCDDGSYGYINQNGKIATYLSKEENKVLTNRLKEKFNINCSVNRDGKYYHIYFSVEEVNKFLKLIKDHVPECMSYKLGPFHKNNLERLKKENLKRRERDKIRHVRNMKNPVKRVRIAKQKQENQRKRLQNPEYKKRHNEYHRIKAREYRKRQKESPVPRPRRYTQ